MYYFIKPFDSQETGSTRIAIWASEDEDLELRKSFRYCDNFYTLKCVYKNSLEEMLRRKIRKALSDPCFKEFGGKISLTEDEIKELYDILDEVKSRNLEEFNQP